MICAALAIDYQHQEMEGTGEGGLALFLSGYAVVLGVKGAI
jgi:hypothetical protein